MYIQHIFQVLFRACLGFNLRFVWIFFGVGVGLIQGLVSLLLLVGLGLVWGVIWNVFRVLFGVGFWFKACRKFIYALVGLFGFGFI